jgi:hypothetical protein
MQQQQLDANRRLAELMGWTNIFQVSGALLGTPPDGAAQSRGQARVPDWNGDWRDCGRLLERYGITRDAIVANEIARLQVGQ